METCLECGSNEFSNAFVFCIHCLNFAVHRYCLAKLPETFDEFVPWVCENCINISSQSAHVSGPPQENNGSSLANLKLTQFSRENDFSSKNVEEHIHDGCPSEAGQDTSVGLEWEGRTQLARNMSPSKENNMSPLKENNMSPSKENLTRKTDIQSKSSEVKEYSDEKSHSDAIESLGSEKCAQISGDVSVMRKKLKKKGFTSSGAETQHQRLWRSPSGELQEACGDFKLETKLKRKDGTYPVHQIKHRKQKKFSSGQSIPEAKRLNLSKQVRSQDSLLSQKVESNEKRANSFQSDKLEHRKDPQARHLRPDFNGPAVSKSISRVYKELSDASLSHGRETELGEGRGTSFYNGKYQLPTTEHDGLGHARPLIDPVWRGSFSIINKEYDIFDGFVAHLSSMACTKVTAEANILTSVLCVEMLPKSQVWPKSFRISEPSHENIALYFFPLDRRQEKMFDFLVNELTNQELAMRASTTNAELLIFSSTELPLSEWRLQGKYYMWGVFKGKQTSQP